MPYLFFALGVLISLVSLVAAFDAAGHSPRHTLHECQFHGRAHRKHHFSYSSVDQYQGGDFLNGS